MSVQHGVDVLGYVPPTLGLTVSPGEQKAECDKVMREAQQLDEDFAASPTDAATKAAWGAFFAEVQKFYNDNANGVIAWLGRAWGTGTINKAIDYGNQLNDWRAKLARVPGARVSEPPVTDVQNRPNSKAIPWTPILIGAVAVAGVAAGGYALSKVGFIGSLVKGRS